MCAKSLPNLGVLTPFVAFGEVETDCVPKQQETVEKVLETPHSPCGTVPNLLILRSSEPSWRPEK